MSREPSRERPILFSAPMVRAILAGTKTQTRRIAPIRKLDILRHPGDLVTWSVSFMKAVKGVLSSHSGGKFSDLQARSIIASQFNPYGAPGSRLWVRETWDFIPEGEPGTPNCAGIRYWADAGYELRTPPSDYNPMLYGKERFRPSIHMPRWASRITLEITDVRMERLQDISEADAMAEGATPMLVPPDGGSAPHVEGFRVLWESINGPGSWDANPWVWVLAFRRLERQ